METCNGWCVLYTFPKKKKKQMPPTLVSDVLSLLMALGLKFPAFRVVTLCARLTDADVSVRSASVNPAHSVTSPNT